MLDTINFLNRPVQHLVAIFLCQQGMNTVQCVYAYFLVNRDDVVSALLCNLPWLDGAFFTVLGRRYGSHEQHAQQRKHDDQPNASLQHSETSSISKLRSPNASVASPPYYKTAPDFMILCDFS